MGKSLRVRYSMPASELSFCLTSSDITMRFQNVSALYGQSKNARTHTPIPGPQTVPIPSKLSSCVGQTSAKEVFLLGKVCVLVQIIHYYT